MTVQIHHVGGRKLATMDTDNPKRCRQRIAGDTSWCETCGQQWGTNDIPGPPCPRYKEGDEMISLLEQGPKTVILMREEVIEMRRKIAEAEDTKRNATLGALLVGFVFGTLVCLGVALAAWGLH